jgi:hypothetical protein
MEGNKFGNGKIYKIVDENQEKCYYGSTCNNLKTRLSHHKANYKRRCLHSKGYKNSVYDIFNEYGPDNCRIELVKLFPCASINELINEEGYYIKHFPCCNKNISGRTRRQYYIDNKVKILEYQNNYNKNKKSIRDLNKIA